MQKGRQTVSPENFVYGMYRSRKILTINAAVYEPFIPLGNPDDNPVSGHYKGPYWECYGRNSPGRNTCYHFFAFSKSK
jgi:hypothetical protein